MNLLDDVGRGVDIDCSMCDATGDDFDPVALLTAEPPFCPEHSHDEREQDNTEQQDAEGRKKSFTVTNPHAESKRERKRIDAIEAQLLPNQPL
jgi:hypothetical protein